MIDKTNGEQTVSDNSPSPKEPRPASNRRSIFLAAGMSAIIGAAVATTLPVLAQNSARPQIAAQIPSQTDKVRAADPRANQTFPSFADLTAQLQPAVVNISTTQRVEVGRQSPFSFGGDPTSPLEDMFRKFLEQQGEDGKPITREATSLGSGFLISPDGYIVTNNHVISGRDGKNPVDTVTVTLSDRREFSAKIVGRDLLSDLAVLKIDGKDLPYVRFGNSQGTRVGDWAIAIGNPFGLGGTVTAGIVSALHRNITGGGAYDRYIQTDASINQGNSGGPLFDMSGNVIGINTAIFSPTGGNVGLGFAIPAELASPVIDQLRQGGRVHRGYLGVQIQMVTPAIATSLGIPKNRGEIVAAIEKGGPAASAGIEQGDVIMSVAGQNVTPDNTLSYMVANTKIGTRVPVELLRKGKRKTVMVTIAERPPESTLMGDDDTEEDAAPSGKDFEAAKRSLGLTLQALTSEIRRQLGVSGSLQGVIISRVDPSSNAAEVGLQRGDIILRIQQQPVATPEEAAKAVEAARRAGRDTVLLLVQRGNGPSHFIGVKIR